jgi:outer membrane protein assembly factor BamB
MASLFDLGQVPEAAAAAGHDALPLVADGKLYYRTHNGRMFVAAAEAKFALLATNELGDRSMFNASPIAVDGQLLVRSDRFLHVLAEASAE